MQTKENNKFLSLIYNKNEKRLAEIYATNVINSLILLNMFPENWHDIHSNCIHLIVQGSWAMEEAQGLRIGKALMAFGGDRGEYIFCVISTDHSSICSQIDALSLFAPHCMTVYAFPGSLLWLLNRFHQESQWQGPGEQERSLGISPLSTSTLRFQLQLFGPRFCGPSSGLEPSQGSWARTAWSQHPGWLGDTTSSHCLSLS